MKKKNACYFCGQEAHTKEHVPPKLMFKGLKVRGDYITVPSCEKHNCTKGGQDQAIICAFLMAFRNKQNKSELGPNLRIAIFQAEKSFERTKYRTLSKKLIVDYPKDIKEPPEVGFILREMEIKKWINSLTAGLVFDCTKSYDKSINWENVENWCPEYIPKKELCLEQAFHIFISNNQKKLELENGNEWRKGWSTYPDDIYSFFIGFSGNEVKFKHVFYNSYYWYVWFTPSIDVKNKLIKRLK